MIQINKAIISRDASEINLDIETQVGSNITSLMLWKSSEFKDYAKATDLSYLLQNTSNKEVINITTLAAKVSDFEGLFFLEIEDDSPEPENCSDCNNPQLVVLTNFNDIYRCMAAELNKITGCISSIIKTTEGCCEPSHLDKVLTINMILESIKINLKLNNFVLAVEQYKKLPRFCRECNSYQSLPDLPCLTCQ